MIWRFLYAPLLLLALLPTTLQAQEGITLEETRYNVNFLNLDLSKLAFKTLQLGYDREFGLNFHMLHLSAGMTYWPGRYEKQLGWNGEIQFRLNLKNNYTHRKKLNWWWGPFANYEVLQITNQTPSNYIGPREWTDHINAFSAGLLLGWKFTYKQRLMFNFYAGPGHQWANIQYEAPSLNSNFHISYDDNVLSPGYRGVFPKFGAQVGVNF